MRPNKSSDEGGSSTRRMSFTRSLSSRRSSSVPPAVQDLPPFNVPGAAVPAGALNVPGVVNRRGEVPLVRGPPRRGGSSSSVKTPSPPSDHSTPGAGGDSSRGTQTHTVSRTTSWRSRDTPRSISSRSLGGTPRPPRRRLLHCADTLKKLPLPFFSVSAQSLADNFGEDDFILRGGGASPREVVVSSDGGAGSGAVVEPTATSSSTSTEQQEIVAPSSVRTTPGENTTPTSPMLSNSTTTPPFLVLVLEAILHLFRFYWSVGLIFLLPLCLIPWLVADALGVPGWSTRTSTAGSRSSSTGGQAQVVSSNSFPDAGAPVPRDTEADDADEAVSDDNVALRRGDAQDSLDDRPPPSTVAESRAREVLSLDDPASTRASPVDEEKTSPPPLKTTKPRDHTKETDHSPSFVARCLLGASLFSGIALLLLGVTRRSLAAQLARRGFVIVESLPMLFVGEGRGDSIVGRVDLLLSVAPSWGSAVLLFWGAVDIFALAVLLMTHTIKKCFSNGCSLNEDCKRGASADVTDSYSVARNCDVSRGRTFFGFLGSVGVERGQRRTTKGSADGGEAATIEAEAPVLEDSCTVRSTLRNDGAAPARNDVVLEISHSRHSPGPRSSGMISDHPFGGSGLPDEHGRKSHVWLDRLVKMLGMIIVSGSVMWQCPVLEVRS